MKKGFIYILLLMVVAVFTSCDKENSQDTGEPYFNFTDATESTSPTGYNVAYTGNTTGLKFVIRSNRPWKIVANSEDTWAKFFPNEGDDDGIVKVIVAENKTFVSREMKFAFVVDGEEQPVLFTVTQAQAIPFLSLSYGSKPITEKLISKAEQTFIINVLANVDYVCSTDSPWLTVESQNVGAKSTDITFAAAVNTDAEKRIGNINFTCAQFPNLNASIKITQEGRGMVLYDDFAWSTYSNAIFPNTTDAKRWDAWTPEELARGWSTTPNTFSKNEPLLYACYGFMKVGKTYYGGDLISPKLSALPAGTHTLLVKFKAVPYMTATGTQDDNYLNVSVIGPGTVSVSQFVIDNWPNYTTDPTCTAIWSQLNTERSFTITGATSDTQLRFLGGDFDIKSVGKGKNRIFLDDIKVIMQN